MREETTTMTAGRRITPVFRFVRLGAVLAIVLGIFGMHALSLHGTTHAEPSPRVATALTGSMAADAVTEHGPHQSGASDDTDDTGGTGHGMGDMVMLCVAMLTAAATLLALLVLVRRVPRLWAVLRPAAARFRPTSWLNPTGTGPPPVWQFSVIRC